MADRIKRLCEWCFWLMLLISPFIDFINGVFTYIQAGGQGIRDMLSTLDLTDEGGLSPSLIIRMLFLALMLVYLFACRHKRAIIMFACIGFSWLLTVGFEFIRGAEFSLSADISYIVRFCYCLMCLVVGEHVIRSGKGRFDLRERVDKFLCVAALTAALGIMIPFIFEIGFYTYADPMGYRGSRGFYYAGNDITVVIMLILPLMLSSWMEQKGKPGLWNYLQLASCAFSVVALLVIGTKTAFIAVAIIAFVALVYAFAEGVKNKNWHPMLRLLLAVAATILVYFLFSAGATVSQSLKTARKYAKEREPGESLLSGRTTYLIMAWHDVQEAMPFSLVAGVGRGSQEHIIEMDLCEVVLYYGVLGTVTMLWLYLKHGLKVIKDLFKSFSLRNLACCTALGLCAGFLVLAGHVLFSVTAGFYFAFMLVYTRMACSKEGLDAKII